VAFFVKSVVQIKDPATERKTYEGFFHTLPQLCKYLAVSLILLGFELGYLNTAARDAQYLGFERRVNPIFIVEVINFRDGTLEPNILEWNP